MHLFSYTYILRVHADKQIKAHDSYLIIVLLFLLNQLIINRSLNSTRQRNIGSCEEMDDWMHPSISQIIYELREVDEQSGNSNSSSIVTVTTIAATAVAAAVKAATAAAAAAAAAAAIKAAAASSKAATGDRRQIYLRHSGDRFISDSRYALIRPTA